MSNFQRQKLHWVLAGWAALHQAALDVGAEVDAEPNSYPGLPPRVAADRRQYVALIQPLTQLLSVDLDTPTLRAEPIRILIWRKLRSNGKSKCPDLWRFFAQVDQVVDPASEYQLMRIGWRSISTNSRCLTPVLSARHGYQLLWQRSHPHLDEISRFLWGLALIGWAAHHWHETGICQLCFRFTYPGARFCAEHRQVGRSARERSNAHSRYRLGRKVYALADHRGLLELLGGGANVRHMRRRLALADVIFEWEFDPSYLDKERDLLLETLVMCPRVLQRIGVSALSADFETLTETLRERIDPYRWDPMLWGSAVVQAELWFSLEEELSPGKRGLGVVTQERIEMAVVLANRGYSKAQIANELGLSPSAISKWIARGRFPKILDKLVS